jgi:hypothetical protein
MNFNLLILLIIRKNSWGALKLARPEANHFLTDSVVKRSHPLTPLPGAF